MSYTKGELISAAFDEIGISEAEFDISVEQRTSAMRRLSAMMADWAARGIKLSYPITKINSDSSTEDSNIPDWAWEAVVTNLAVRLAPSYGKAVSVETKVAAKNSLNTLRSNFCMPREMQMASMPKGAGYKAIDNPFTPIPESPYIVPVDEDIDFSGGPDES